MLVILMHHQHISIDQRAPLSICRYLITLILRELIMGINISLGRYVSKENLSEIKTMLQNNQSILKNDD